MENLLSDLPGHVKDLLAIYTSLDDLGFQGFFPFKRHYAPTDHVLGFRSEGSRINYFVGRNGLLVHVNYVFGRFEKVELTQSADREEFAKLIAATAIAQAQTLFKVSDLKLTFLNSDRATFEAIHPLPDQNLVEIYGYEYNFWSGKITNVLKTVPSEARGG